MSRVASAPTRVVAYLPGLRTILQRLRATTSTPSSLHPTLLTTTTTTTATVAITTTQFSDALYNADLASTRLHPQLPLPGAMGIIPPTPSPSAPIPPPLSTSPLDLSEEQLSVMAAMMDKPQGLVECLVQDCPPSLHQGFLLLFPGVSLKYGRLTVITLSEKTEHDMTSWSPAVEDEREQLLEQFIDSAKEICSRLTAAGNWADFIDPSSGRAFYSPYSHATLFETDDRFRYFGFEILDLGCCKCISHPLWGPYTFVGTIFTDAPTSTPAIQTIMKL